MLKNIWLFGLLIGILAGCGSLSSQPVITAQSIENFKISQSSNLLDSENFVWQPLVEKLELPTSIAIANDGSGRLFILEKAGRVRIVTLSGELFDKPFLDIRKRVLWRSSEQGLLNLVFHPNYLENGYFFIFYTNKVGDAVLSRFQVSEKGDLANPDSELIILKQEHPAENHIGGGMFFGPDGYLYLGKGDGSKSGEPYGVGQDLNSWLGKILRIDINNGNPYAIPADNPFVNGGGLPEIWAYGLRNPWRISYDSISDNFYIADVGHYQWEEVNVVPIKDSAKLNFGWDIYEASHPYKDQLAWPVFDVTMPIIEYSHNVDCSVTGGYVYRGKNIPELQGIYLFGDFCSGTIWGLKNTSNGWESSVLFDTNFTITTFGLDETGEIYLASYDGTIYKLVRAP